MALRGSVNSAEGFTATEMKKYINKENLSNLGFLFIGAALFFSSFAIGESTLVGGFMHLSGCAFFCCGVHKKWCKDVCNEAGCCEINEMGR
jgi:hypothetical protein